MLPFPSNFLSELLALPHERVAYEAARRVEALRPGRVIFETDNCGSFDLVEALERGLVDGHVVDSVPAQKLHRYYEHNERTQVWIENAIHEVSFEGCVLEIVTVSYVEGESTSLRHILVGPDREIVERFFLRVSKMSSEIDGEILVFENGKFQKDTKLFKAIRETRLDDLVLRGTLLSEIVADVRSFFESKALYARYRIPHKRGILLYGPPGNGKTHFLKGLLGTLSVPCIYVKSLVNQSHNDHDALRRIFVRARAVSPCLMVLEDLETIVGDHNRSFFLNELDGFSDNSGVVVLATTNYPEKIDPAIIDRPSRFDRKYLFDLPSAEERLAYLERWSRALEAEMRPSEERLRWAMERTRDFSFAYLKELTVSATIAWVKTPVVGAMDIVLGEIVTMLKEQVKQGRSPKSGQTSRRVGLIPEA